MAKQPPQISWIKSMMAIPRLAHNPFPVLQENLKLHGPIYGASAPGGKVIITHEPAYIQHVLQKNHRNYTKSDVQLKVLASQLGKGLLTIDGDHWLKQRRLIQPGFHRQKLAALVDIMNQESAAFVNEWEARGGAFKQEIVDEMMKITFRIVAKSLFSSGMEDEQLSRISQVIGELQYYIITQVRRPFLIPFWKLTGKVKKYDELHDEVHEVMVQLIKDRIDSGEQHDDLLDMLINSRYEDTGEAMSAEQIKDEGIIIFVAGHETTANAMSWMLYLLAQHPEVVDKVLAEIDSVLGGDNPDFARLPQLQYTQQVIQESMRMYPPAWAVDRVALGDDQLGEYHIPKGSILLLYIHGAHNNPQYWEGPERFDPDRFAPDKVKQQTKYSYLPFGGGPRLCIGNNFAMMEMKVLLVHLLRKFKFELLPDQKIEMMPMVTLRPRHGIKFTISPR